MLKKPFKYYAIRIANTIVFRRTTQKLQQVKSVLRKPGTEFHLIQITYVGGTIVGCMSYNDWVTHGGKQIGLMRYTRVTREQYKALDPYILKDRS